MNIFPAIDIYGGKAERIRWVKGVPEQALRLVQLLLCTLCGSTIPRKRPGRQWLRLGPCLQPGSCYATLLAPRPRRGP